MFQVSANKVNLGQPPCSVMGEGSDRIIHNFFEDHAKVHRSDDAKCFGCDQAPTVPPSKCKVHPDLPDVFLCNTCIESIQLYQTMVRTC